MQEAFREEIRRHKEDIDYDNPRCGEFFFGDAIFCVDQRPDRLVPDRDEGGEGEGVPRGAAHHDRLGLDGGRC